MRRHLWVTFQITAATPKAAPIPAPIDEDSPHADATAAPIAMPAATKRMSLSMSLPPHDLPLSVVELVERVVEPAPDARLAAAALAVARRRTLARARAGLAVIAAGLGIAEEGFGGPSHLGFVHPRFCRTESADLQAPELVNRADIGRSAFDHIRKLRSAPQSGRSMLLSTRTSRSIFPEAAVQQIRSTEVRGEQR
jgi:hypothetical protein